MKQNKKMLNFKLNHTPLMICMVSFGLLSCGDESTGFKRSFTEENGITHSTEDLRPPRQQNNFESNASQAAAPSSSTDSPHSTDSTQALLPDSQASERDPLDDELPAHDEVSPVAKNPEPLTPPQTTPMPDPQPTPMPDPQPTPMPDPQPTPMPIPLPKTLELYFKPGPSSATFISCTWISFTTHSSSGQKLETLASDHFFGCSDSRKKGTEQEPRLTLQLKNQNATCGELSLRIRTYRTKTDHQNGQPFWERVLSSLSTSDEPQFFEISQWNTPSRNGLSVGYEDLPGPYSGTDQDNNDMILDFEFPRELQVKTPPLQSDCTSQ